MDTLTAIMSRASAVRLGEPAPTAEQLQAILDAATMAPDHGRFEPWRFVVLQGRDREILGNAMADLLRRAFPDTSGTFLAREAAKPLRAPTIIVAAASIRDSENVPEIEQVLAVGAAVQNMFLVAHALGLGAMWKTGPVAYDAPLKLALGLRAEDHIVAFLYLGAVVGGLPPSRPRSHDVVLSLPQA